MFDKILSASNRYDEGLARVYSRQDQWLAAHERVRDHLKAIADYLNKNTRYKQGFFVDTLLAFNEGMRGTNTRMPSVQFRSGEMPMPLTFRNSIGEKMTYKEEGFYVSFNPTITGQIMIVMQPHFSDLDDKPGEYISLGIVNEPAQLTDAMIEDVIEKSLEIAFHSSFTGMAERFGGDDHQENIPLKRHPIGFRRHDTTEKI